MTCHTDCAGRPLPKSDHLAPRLSGWGVLRCNGRPILSGAAILIPEGIDDLITANEAASLCGVSAEAIRKWASRGILSASGMDQRGRKLYKLIDVAKAERATRDKARR